MLQFIRSKTYELAGGRRRLRDSPVLISGLISLEQEDTAGLLAGAAARLGRSRDPTREAAAPITCSSAARSAAQTGSRQRGPTPAAHSRPRKTPPALPWPPTRARPAARSLERRHVEAPAARPGPRLLPRPGLTAPRLPSLALLPPRQLLAAGGARDPYGNRPPPRAGLGGAAAPRLPSRTWPRAWLRGRALVGVPRPLKDLF